MSTWPVVRHSARWREDLPGTSWRWLLTPAWLAYRPLVALNSLAHDRGWQAHHRLPVPVISVGNLIAGGTGKTPATRFIAEHLLGLGRHPAVLSRGYRAGASGRNEEAGLFGAVPVVCNPDRCAGGRTAIAAGADVLVLDDGFQHRRLHRDLDIVLVDATRPWGSMRGNGMVLPLGYMREGRRALHRADLIWISRADLVSQEVLVALRGELQAAVGHQVPVIEEVLETADVVTLDGTTATPAQAMAGQSVVVVSGIGHPAAFEWQVERLGMVVVQAHRFPDHHHYDGAELAELEAEAKARGATLITTAKDAVKWRALQSSLPALVLEPQYRFAGDGAEVLAATIAGVVPRVSLTPPPPAAT